MKLLWIFLSTLLLTLLLLLGLQVGRQFDGYSDDASGEHGQHPRPPGLQNLPAERVQDVAADGAVDGVGQTLAPEIRQIRIGFLGIHFQSEQRGHPPPSPPSTPSTQQSGALPGAPVLDAAQATHPHRIHPPGAHRQRRRRRPHGQRRPGRIRHPQILPQRFRNLLTRLLVKARAGGAAQRHLSASQRITSTQFIHLIFIFISDLF